MGNYHARFLEGKPRKGADLLDTHILLVDTGNSYQGLCSLIHDRTHGEDGIYITYEEDNPIAFNPFYTDSGELTWKSVKASRH